ncbi:MAG: hypothetical protein AB7G87_03835 [Clostridia bacterium]
MTDNNTKYPICYSLLYKQSEDFVELVVKNYKFTFADDSNYDHFCNAYILFMKLNGWIDNDLSITKEYYESIKSEEMDCKKLRRIYKQQNISDYCYVCDKCLAYKNSKVIQEEEIIAYILNNPSCAYKLKTYELSPVLFESLSFYINDTKIYLLSILRDIYSILENTATSIKKQRNKSSLIDYIHVDYILMNLPALNPKYSEQKAIEIARQYLYRLMETKVNKEQFGNSLNVVKCIVKENKEECKPLEKTSSDTLPSLINLDDTTDISTSDKDAPQDKQNLLVRNVSSMVISQSNGHLQPVPSPTHNTKKINLDNSDTLVEGIELNSKKPNFDAVEIRCLFTLEEYQNFENELLTSNSLVIEYYPGSNNVLLFYTQQDDYRVYLIDCRKVELFNKFVFLLQYPGLQKVINDLTLLGLLVSEYIQSIVEIFDIKTAEALLNGNLLVADTLSNQTVYDNNASFNMDTKNKHLTDAFSCLIKYKKYKRRIKKDYGQLYIDHIAIIKAIAASSDIILRKSTAENIVKVKLKNTEKMVLKDTIKGVADIKIPPAHWLIEQGLLQIVNSKLARINAFKIYSYGDDEICLACSNLFFPFVFDMLNQFTITTFKNYVIPEIKPYISTIIIKSSFNN